MLDPSSCATEGSSLLNALVTPLSAPHQHLLLLPLRCHVACKQPLQHSTPALQDGWACCDVKHDTAGAGSLPAAAAAHHSTAALGSQLSAWS